jgi:hypothetical protein
MQERSGVCWPHGGTVGRMSADSDRIRGHFAAHAGSDAVVCCELVDAGKFRNGAARAWCRTHLHYWGVKADLAALDATGLRQCARHADPLHYVLDPLCVDPRDYQSVTIAMTSEATFSVTITEPEQHYAAVSALLIACEPGLFRAPGITHIHLTPSVLATWHAMVQRGMTIGCVDCARCGHPHLDLGEFASREHRRHTCGNCGIDSTYSAHAIVSHPLFAVPSVQIGPDPRVAVLRLVPGGRRSFSTEQLARIPDA